MRGRYTSVSGKSGGMAPASKLHRSVIDTSCGSADLYTLVQAADSSVELKFNRVGKRESRGLGPCFFPGCHCMERSAPPKKDDGI